MKFFKNDGKKHIDTNSAIEVSLEFVLTEIDRFPTEDEFEGGFLGIINDEDETIHLVRFNDNRWFLDFPVCEEGTYSHSLQSADLTTMKVKDIVKKFFLGEDWKVLCDLESTKRKPLSDETKRRIECFKEVGNEGAVMISEEVLTKEEFIQKLEDFPRSSNDTTYGIFAELSKPFIMIKNSDGQWKVMLDFDNPNINIEMGEDEKYQSFEKISDPKKWVNEEF